MKALIAVLGAVCLTLGLSLAARAEPATEAHGDESEQSAAAAAHFERGVEFYREGSLDAALVEFERAYELIPNYRLLFNLAQIQTERHAYAAALGHFEKYLLEGAEELPEARRAQAEREIERLRALVAYLWVESDVEGAQLYVNDAQVATLPLTVAVAINPGVCNVRLEKTGYVPVQHALKVAAGEHPRLRVSLLTRGSARADASSGAADGSGAERGPSHAASASYAPFWIASSTTLGLGAATLALGLSARNADQELSAELDQVPGDSDQIEEARSRLKLFSALTDTFAALSVVGLGFSIYFLVKPPKSAAPSARDAAQRSLQILPGFRGVALRARF